MSTLSDFFIAEGDTVPQYDGGEAIPDDDKCQFRRLTPLQLTQFLAVLRGVGYDVALSREFPLLTSPDADEWTMAVPPDMVDRLAQVENEHIASLAEQSAEASQEELGWLPADFEPVISRLATLARRAKAAGKRMYFWNCL